MPNSSIKPEKILNRNKHYKLFIDLNNLLEKFHNKPIKSLIRHSNDLKKIYAEARYIYLKGVDLTIKPIAEDLPSIHEDLVFLSSLLSTIEQPKELDDILKKKYDIDLSSNRRKEIEDIRIHLCEEKYKFTERTLKLKERVKNLILTINCNVVKNPEKYNKHVRVIIKDNIIECINLIDRPDWSSDNLNFFKRSPNKDIRHWKSSDLIKHEIKKMFEHQPFALVAEHLIEKQCAAQITNTYELQNALYKYWSDRYNQRSNLRLGDSFPNQALGRLIPILNSQVLKGKNEFKEFWLNMKSFGIENPDKEHPHHIHIDSWETLMDYHFNANFDFDFKGDKTSMDFQLNEAESEFRFLYNK